MLGIVSPLLSAVPGVSHRFFGRIGGTSPSPWLGLNISHDVNDSPARVDENLARVRFQLGVGKDALFTATQVHGADVIEVTEVGGVGEVGDDLETNQAIRAREADALFTRAADRAVGVRTADCAPILIAVDDGSVVAAAHAGWRGAVGGIIGATVAAMNVPPERLVAAVGPTIGFDAFEVGPEVIEAARAVVDEADLQGLIRAGRDDRHHLDLASLCVRLLKKAGISRVEAVGGCTVSQAEQYFSHRRENGVTGRQMSAIARTVPTHLDDETFR